MDWAGYQSQIKRQQATNMRVRIAAARKQRLGRRTPQSMQQRLDEQAFFEQPELPQPDGARPAYDPPPASYTTDQEGTVALQGASGGYRPPTPIDAPAPQQGPDSRPDQPSRGTVGKEAAPDPMTTAMVAADMPEEPMTAAMREAEVPVPRTPMPVKAEVPSTETESTPAGEVWAPPALAKGEVAPETPKTSPAAGEQPESPVQEKAESAQPEEPGRSKRGIRNSIDDPQTVVRGQQVLPKSPPKAPARESQPEAQQAASPATEAPQETDRSRDSTEAPVAQEPTTQEQAVVTPPRRARQRPGVAPEGAGGQPEPQAGPEGVATSQQFSPSQDRGGRDEVKMLVEGLKWTIDTMAETLRRIDTNVQQLQNDVKGTGTYK